MTGITPKTRMNDLPIWHHHHSFKITAIGFNHILSPERKTLLLESNAVRVKIYPSSRQEGWYINHRILHTEREMWSEGSIWISDDDLQIAFGISDSNENKFGQELLNTYGGDVAYQGKYIRYKNCLNIPGPGTGNDGDPNVSIYITEDIKNSIKQLLESSN